MQYSEKIFVNRIKNNNLLLSVAQQLWESVCANDKKSAYQHIVESDLDLNAICGQEYFGTSWSHLLTPGKDLMLKA